MSKSKNKRSSLVLGPDLSPHLRDRARQVVAQHSGSAEELAMFLSMLGVDKASESAPGRCACGAELPFTATAQTRAYNRMCTPCRKAVSV